MTKHDSVCNWVHFSKCTHGGVCWLEGIRNLGRGMLDCWIKRLRFQVRLLYGTNVRAKRRFLTDRAQQQFIDDASSIRLALFSLVYCLPDSAMGAKDLHWSFNAAMRATLYGSESMFIFCHCGHPPHYFDFTQRNPTASSFSIREILRLEVLVNFS